MSKKSFEKIEAGLTEALAHAKGEDVGARIYHFVTAEDRLKRKVAVLLQAPEAQEAVRRNHAAIKAKLTTPPST